MAAAGPDSLAPVGIRYDVPAGTPDSLSTLPATETDGFPMPTLPARAAAYTRTGILRRFLDQVSDALPPKVDSAYAEARLGLKGGDVRAFLQSLRVLGLIDPYGQITDRGRRTRGPGQRAEAMEQGLRDAYPELLEQWHRRGGMQRDEVEGFFKVEYGLSASCTGPAAKLFTDLMREFVRAGPAVAETGIPSSNARPVPGQPQSCPPNARSAGGSPRGGTAAEPEAAPRDLRLAALETVRSVVKINIDSDWDDAKIQTTLDRFEQLMQRILRSPPEAGHGGSREER